MVLGFNLFLFTLIVLPALIYGAIIYFTSPYKSINIVKGLPYLLVGTFAHTLVYAVRVFLPNWYYVATGNYILDVFLLMFTRVAIIEELIKLTTFYILFRLSKQDKTITPHAIMFYCGMNALGFALIENVGYAMHFGEVVLYIRTFTATILHMLTGLFLGYFIALTRFSHKIQTRSVYDFIMKKFAKIKNIVLILLGLLMNILLHGTYNFNLGISGNASMSIMLVMIFLGLYVAKEMSIHLYRISKE